MSEAADVVTACVSGGLTLGAAESLTGGLVAAAVTSVPGASAIFRGGVTAYATDLKASLLGVPLQLLESRGPVDPDVAAAMAHGARRLLGADVALATTGVAGPDPQGGQPVGTVYVAVTGPCGHAPDVEGLHLDGGRAEIREATVGAVLDLVVRRIREHRDCPRMF